jgi:uncharacterized repeat protein (TIGR01451 family)
MIAPRPALADGQAADSWRWPRLLAIASAAIALASCRSLGTPPLAGLAAGAAATAGLVAATADTADSVTADSVGAAATAPRAGSVPPRITATRPSADAPPAAVPLPRTTAARVVDPAVTAAGCERPCPPLPRLHAGGCRGCGMAGPACASGGCGSCPTEVCLPLAAPVPLVAPCLVCDGGDHGRPAMPMARFGLANLSAGDTVARYRADGDGPGTDDVHVVASNCACVYAPRFGSVREVIRPHEEARKLGPRGLALDTSTAAQVDLQPVCRSTQSLAPNAARKALPGVALEERLGPLAVDQGGLPHESIDGIGPRERVQDDQLERAQLVQPPRMVVGFDVPLAWTCARAAMVTVGRQQADVIASDRGTATLRIESPGRAELTLCKRAGTDTARSGEEIDFMIYLFNSGDRPLADVVLADALPARLDYVPDSAAANAPAVFSTGTGDDGAVVLTWRFEHTFQPGEGGFVRFRSIVR